MCEAKAVLVPSTWDVFNLACTEAMAAGKPVVVSDGAGAADLIDHGVNGFVFRNGDAAALCECVYQLESMDAHKLNAIGRAAANTVRERLDPEQIAEGKIDIYLRLPSSAPNQHGLLSDLLLHSAGCNPLKFLDNFSLKDLASYVLSRGLKKVHQR